MRDKPRGPSGGLDLAGGPFALYPKTYSDTAQDKFICPRPRSLNLTHPRAHNADRDRTVKKLVRHIYKGIKRIIRVGHRTISRWGGSTSGGV